MRLDGFGQLDFQAFGENLVYAQETVQVDNLFYGYLEQIRQLKQRVAPQHRVLDAFNFRRLLLSRHRLRPLWYLLFRVYDLEFHRQLLPQGIDGHLRPIFIYCVVILVVVIHL